MTTNHPNGPRALIHRQILDSAATQPEASMEELASGVAGASTDLVERVLEEYGDPGRNDPPADPTSEEDSMIEHATPPTVAELTHKERRTLRVIADHPDATQAEMAEILGVTRATVNKRVNAIEGFGWEDRRAFVAAVFDEDVPAGADEDAPLANGSSDGASAPAAEAASDGGQGPSPDLKETVAQLQERVTRLEEQLADATADTGPVIEDTALLAKVVRAVLADEAIFDEEELRVLMALL